MKRTISVGLTGSIGAGKTTTAGFFSELGIPVWDADAAVQKLYADGGLGVTAIATLVPEAAAKGNVDRAQLRKAIASNPALLPRIESVIHPLIMTDRRRALQETSTDLMIFDVPLLFETESARDYDYIVVAVAPIDVRRRRVLSRGTMTEVDFEMIAARQMPDDEKVANADFVVDTSRGFDFARSAVRSIIAEIRKRGKPDA